MHLMTAHHSLPQWPFVRCIVAKVLLAPACLTAVQQGQVHQQDTALHSATRHQGIDKSHLRADMPSAQYLMPVLRCLRMHGGIQYVLQ
jgi:hypothetical protein